MYKLTFFPFFFDPALRSGGKKKRAQSWTERFAANLSQDQAVTTELRQALPGAGRN
ncbi:MAG: hypothetical protein KKI15_17730 [Proteobacteria bacterium]|nr:hypothetical protein [Pseudomonadota bacterium]MBU1420325.1 hypothetical protein [Pseudomonadota bacterium]